MWINKRPKLVVSHRKVLRPVTRWHALPRYHVISRPFSLMCHMMNHWYIKYAALLYRTCDFTGSIDVLVHVNNARYCEYVYGVNDGCRGQSLGSVYNDP